MGIREDLVASAITFLKDPSVARAPLEKRIAFLQSKNLTQEEIDVSLARADDGASVQNASAPDSYARQNQPLTGQPPPYGYGPYPSGYWQQTSPQVPRRDWRDYFIMATVMSGLSYGLYFIAKRYVVPLIAPPTPPQLEQDKASVDESFNRAFSLIEQLSNDTAAIRASEDARKERLDAALNDFEAGIRELKEASKRRDEDTRRISDEVGTLQGLIPRAIQTQQDNTDARLKDLNAEFKSLRTLVSNRVITGNANHSKPAVTSNGGATGGSEPVNRSTIELASSSEGQKASENHQNGLPDRTSAASPYGRFMSGKGGIPAWQMAASKRNEENNGEKKAMSESGTAADAIDNSATVAS